MSRTVGLLQLHTRLVTMTLIVRINHIKNKEFFWWQKKYNSQHTIISRQSSTMEKLYGPYDFSADRHRSLAGWSKQANRHLLTLLVSSSLPRDSPLNSNGIATTRPERVTKEG